jgi:hypothetical protein
MEEDDELEVFFMPNENSGDNDDNDDNDESELNQRGRDTDSFSVIAGEGFKIESQYDGWVENDDKKFKLVKKHSGGGFDILDDTDQIGLKPGNYLFHEDGMTIEQLKSTFFRDEES